MQRSDVTMRMILVPYQAKTVAVRLSTVLGTAVLLAACGSGGTSNGDSAGGAPAGPAVAQSQNHAKLGKILVAPSGKTLYFTDQETDGMIRCVGTCLEFWLPATSPDGAAPSGPDVTALDVLRRPDNGQAQLTYKGKPLYSFSLDESAGDINGNNVEDDFGGTHFVWHAATIDTGSPATPSPAPESNDGGYGGTPGY
jgi:predicted lipoprotein with Yx(FWY)xxD motif